MDCDIVSYHIDSFNYLVEKGIQAAVCDIAPVKFKLENELIELKYETATFGRPTLLKKPIDNADFLIYPSECRQRGLTYRAPLKVIINIKIEGMQFGTIDCIAGEVPVMLCTKICNLQNFTPNEMVSVGEESTEKGGYFVCKGTEKVMRLLVANKRNFPLAIERQSLRDKGKLFSQYSIMMRSIRGNFLASIMNLHYLENATIILSIQYEREVFYIPLMYMLKCLTKKSDRRIYEHMTRARPNDSFWSSCVTNMLSMAQNDNIYTQQNALNALGSRFRIVLENRYNKDESDAEMTEHLIERCVAIHLKTNEEKFFCLIMMAQKLIALVKGEILSESLDNPQFQEASISGHIILLILRERLERMLLNTRRRLEILQNKNANKFTLTIDLFTKAFQNFKTEITNGLEYFLATGNLITKDGLGLMQKNGFAVIAERINQLRFVSHFRAIHRGAFFMEMRTTDVRKLRPEGWGFICPVHTPDGAPCGLLNHLTASCKIVTHYSKTKKLKDLLVSIGVIPHSAINLMKDNSPTYSVIIDGNFFGYISCDKAFMVERYLRSLKVDSKNLIVPYTTEITLIQTSTNTENIMSQYPGLYIYTEPGRFIRPVKNLLFDCVEFIGIFEQVYLSIAIKDNEIEEGVTIHQELHLSSLFSFAGNLIPFPDHNQSPRNVYQCQMGKQTMGVPVHAWRTRADGKMYLLQTPQTPLVKLEAYDKYEMEYYPLGTHACVAVVSYTGYDMEDAMVINKASYERGFAHGSVIKVERIDLSEKNGFRVTCDKVFYSDPKNQLPTIDKDGLPIPGRVYCKDEPYYSIFDRLTGTFKTFNFKYAENAWCSFVRIVSDDNFAENKTHALIQWRIMRNPIIGDKFASRHGQKGINSFLWPTESLPFSENGMVPDIIFNPHGFPSRMTIGMMIESMAGKAACLNGDSYNASPFIFNEKNTAIEHFGELLTKAGYNYLGNETMYSGVDGSEMEVQIFFGVVYYQRLRHMIADKFQVRSTGNVDPITMQPIKGRKVGGGIRFGEMERDALIAHGTAFCLQDRLFNCSDKDEAYVCANCGSIVSVTKLCKKKAIEEESKRLLNAQNEFKNINIKSEALNFSIGNEIFADALNISSNAEKIDEKNKFKTQNNLRNFNLRHCTVCQSANEIYLMQIPRIFRYLCAELSSMNVKVSFKVSHPSDVIRS